MTGQVFMGRYEAIRLLGEGGMGRVFLARQLDSGREVVVKVLHDEIAAQPKVRDCFRQEMLFLARFRHPHVVSLIEASAADDPAGLCLVMEYIPGITLEQLRRGSRRLDPERVGRLLSQLCLALHAAEALKIIHRDLKPANLMVVDPDTPGEKLKVMDFGLAKPAAALYLPKERLEDPEHFFSACGTPEYICPEQVRGDEVDHRGDLYSTGVILFELLTGRLPFDRGTIKSTLLAHANDPVPRFAEVGVKDVPPAIEEVVQSCLAKYPVERPQTARALAERYERALGRKLTRPEDWVLLPATRMSGVRPALRAAAARRPADRHTVVHQLEAWMPERIAVIKLLGFVHDVGGEVIESVPGRIRVRLAGLAERTATPRGSHHGLLARFGRGPKVEEAPPPPGIQMELHMEKQDAGTLSRLRVTVLLRPEGGAQQATDPAWRTRCDELHRDLCAYLIGRG
jgi:serine/threonine-protein kinase